MIKQLHKRLTALYTITTGLILTAVVIGILVVSAKEMEKKNLEGFQNHVLNIISRIQTGSTIDCTWLSRLESEGNLIIHIEDNQTPFLYAGSWTPPTGRDLLIERAKEAAAKEGIHTGVRPVSSSLLKSSVFQVTGDHGDAYYGSVLVTPSRKGFQSLTLLSYKNPSAPGLRRQRILYPAFNLIGIGALFLVSWFLVGKSLKPIEENQKKQQEFIAAASHELRAPLSVIRSSLSAISADPDNQELFIKNMDMECSRMSHLVNDLLFLASADAKSWTIRREPLETDTLLIDFYEKYEPLCREHSVAFRLQLPEEPLPSIKGDRYRLEQVLSILMDNALTYTPSGKGIELSADIKKHSLFLTISDEGCGILEKAKRHIFDRFYRADDSRTEKQHYGLGLSIAKELVTLHKGTISVSDSPSKGACFTIELPLA